MILRTLFFLLLIYLLTKVISRLFLSSSSQNSGGNQTNNRTRGRRQGNDPFYRFYQNRDTRQQGKSSLKQRLDEIEDADFEDVTETEEDKESGP